MPSGNPARTSFFSIRKPRYCRNIFGSLPNDPKIEAWLRTQMEGICIKGDERMKNYLKFDVINRCPISAANPGEGPQSPCPVAKIQVVSGHSPSVKLDDDSSGRLFVAFPEVPSPVVAPASPTTAAGITTLIQKAKSSSQKNTLFGSLSVRKSGQKRHATSNEKKMDVDGEAPVEASKRKLVL